MKINILVITGLLALPNAYAGDSLRGFSCSVSKNSVPEMTVNVFLNAQTPAVVTLENGDQIQISAKLLLSYAEDGITHNVVELLQDKFDSKEQKIGHGKLTGEFHKGATPHFTNGDTETSCIAAY